jgi:hypothetical protein
MSVKNLSKKILNSRLFKVFGISLINYDLLKYTKHYLWALNLRKIPTLKITYNEAKKVTEQEVLLCRRLILAYRKATSDRVETEKNTSRLWSQTLNTHYRKLISVMDSQDAQELAKILSSMFREDFVYGLASGCLVDNAHSCIGAKIWSMKYQDNVVALAEYLGVVRTESSQQGVKRHGLAGGLDSVVAKIEKTIGIAMDFPDIGAPYGVRANNSLITMEHPEHLYVALRINHAVRDYLRDRDGNPLNLAEIGAGFGGLAYWIIKLRQVKINTYTIIDLPLINVLQGYFLANAFGVSAVKLYGETSHNNAVISILPNFAFDSETKTDIDVLINENSMPEMSWAIVENYLGYAKKQVTGIFFSYNHEAYSVVNGAPQVCVPEVVERVGGFKRLSRNASWVRNGYVEEVYQRAK